MADFDVAVVGAGCSGLWAAVTARRGGGRVLLLERNAGIGERILCAEGVGRAGLSALMPVRPEWIAEPVDGVFFRAPGGQRAEIREPGAGFVAHKEIVLRDLAGAAAEAGVEIRLGCEVRDLRQAGPREWSVEIATGSGVTTVSCGSVVGADGIECRIGRRLGIKRALKRSDLFLCAQYTVAPVDAPVGAIEIHLGREVAPGGYAWVFPKGEGVANVGLGVLGEPGGRPAVEYLKRFVRARCPESKIVKAVVGGVPSEREPFKASAGGVFLAGDAARMPDPVSGAGIVPGMASGEVAGRHALRHALGQSDLEAGDREFAKAMRAMSADRKVHWALRQALTRMSDKDLAKMVALIGDYAGRGLSLRSNPMAFVGFLARKMPTCFRLARHLVGV
ncbi:MAG: NAD(P)/FAD-dependent oxidoreductase [bacterium]